jgi:tetratricopeptide (TPR) repeat protein
VVVEHAVAAVHALPPLEACADLEALMAPVAPPPEPAARDRVAAVRGQLAELRALRDAGLYQRARAGVDAMRAGVGALGYRPVLAETLELAGLLAEDTGDFAAAAATLGDAALAAEAGRHDRVLASALVESISVIGYHQGRPAGVEELRRRADAALERIARPPELEAALLEALGQVAVVAGAFAEARGRFEAELALLEQRHGRDDVRLDGPLRGLGTMMIEENRPDLALPVFERRLAIDRRIYSDDHPNVASALESVAGAQYALSRYAEAEANYLRARRVYERAYGADSHRVANVLHNLANVCSWQDRAEEAVSLLRRAIEIDDRALGREHPTTLSHLQALATVLETLSRYPEAIDALDRARAGLRKELGEDHPRIAENLSLLAIVKLADGKPREARDLARQSVAMYRRTIGDRYRPLAELRTIGAASLQLGEPGIAVDALLESHAHLLPGDDPGHRAWIEGLLGRALVDSGRDVARGHALIRAAWDHVRKDDRMDDQRAELSAWMRAHGVAVAR